MAQSRLGSSTMSFALERRAFLIATFLTNDPSRFSFSDIRSDIRYSQGTATILKLNYRRLAWGEKNPHIYGRSDSPTISYCSVELDFITEMFTEAKYPNVLLCIIRTSNQGQFKYEVLAFRLRSESEVRLFLDLFVALTEDLQFDVVTVPRNRTTSRVVNLEREPLYSTSMSTSGLRSRPASLKLRKSVSASLPPSNAVWHQPLTDGYAVNSGGIPRRKKQYSTIDSERHRQRMSDSRIYDDQNKNFVVIADRDAARPTSVRLGRSEVEEKRLRDRDSHRTSATRNTGVKVNFNPRRRHRPGDYVDLDGGLDGQRVRMYTAEDGIQMEDVFGQTKLRDPSRRIVRSSSRHHGSATASGNNDSFVARALTGRKSRTGEHPTGMHETEERRNGNDSNDAHEQRTKHKMSRRQTLVDNGVVKVTVEEYQDPAETKPEEPSHNGERSRVIGRDRYLDRPDVDRRNGVKLNPNERIEWSPEFDLTDGEQRTSSQSTGLSPLIRSSAMTSSVRKVFSRPSGHRSTSQNGRIVNGRRLQEPRQQERQPSYKEDSLYHVQRPDVVSPEEVYHSRSTSTNRRQPMNSERRYGRSDVYDENEYGWREGTAVSQTRRSTVYRTEPRTSR